MAPKLTVELDTSAVERMLEGLEERAEPERIRQAAATAARQLRVTGVPRGETGDLGDPANFQVRVTDDGAELVSVIPYARHVFRGTRYVDPRPPTIEGLEAFLEEIKREVFD